MLSLEKVIKSCLQNIIVNRKKSYKVNEGRMKLTGMIYKKVIVSRLISKLVQKIWRELRNPKGIGNPIIDF